MPLGLISVSLDKSSPTPLYQQLRCSLRDAIEQDLLSPDEALPAERDLADEFQVSRITVRKAIEGLVEEGLIDRRHGAGTFVAARIRKNMSVLSSFSEDMASRGWRARSVGGAPNPGRQVDRGRTNYEQRGQRGRQFVLDRRAEGLVPNRESHARILAGALAPGAGAPRS